MRELQPQPHTDSCGFANADLLAAHVIIAVRSTHTRQICLHFDVIAFFAIAIAPALPSFFAFDCMDEPMLAAAAAPGCLHIPRWRWCRMVDEVHDLPAGHEPTAQFVSALHDGSTVRHGQPDEVGAPLQPNEVLQAPNHYTIGTGNRRCVFLFRPLAFLTLGLACG